MNSAAVTTTPLFPADLEQWARRCIGDYDQRSLGVLQRRLCEGVLADFFGVTGRVLFGAASVDDSRRLLDRLEVADDLTEGEAWALVRQAEIECDHALSCACEQLRARARLLLQRAADPARTPADATSTHRYGALR